MNLSSPGGGLGPAEKAAFLSAALHKAGGRRHLGRVGMLTSGKGSGPALSRALAPRHQPPPGICAHSSLPALPASTFLPPGLCPCWFPCLERCTCSLLMLFPKVAMQAGCQEHPLQGTTHMAPSLETPNPCLEQPPAIPPWPSYLLYCYYVSQHLPSPLTWLLMACPSLPRMLTTRTETFAYFVGT